MSRLLNKTIVVFAGGLALGASTGRAQANDIGEAVDFAQKHLNRGALRNYEAEWRERPRHEAIGMLHSRDIEHGKPLYEYDCLDSAIDTKVLMRTSSKEKAALRQCLEHRFERDRLPGYKTLGSVRLDAVYVRPFIETHAAQYEVPAVVLKAIIMLASGFRPHAESDRGHMGLMQLRPDLLRAHGIAHGSLFDPQENIRAGAAYVRALVFKHGGIRSAMLAYDDGGVDMTYKRRMKRWFVNNVVAIYYGDNRKFPYKLGAENMTFVWTWLE